MNDFIKITSIFYAGVDEAQQLRAAGQVLANGEELTAHANALKVRSE